MNEIVAGRGTDEGNAAARQRILSGWGEPLFYAAWKNVLMIHFEVEVEPLQRFVPYPLDLRDGRAYVSLVAFTMQGMHPRRGGRLLASLFKPIATHHFLNLRTYVRHRREFGIHFIAEWLSSRLAAKLGPMVFGLPYRYGRIEYAHDWEKGKFSGRVTDVSSGGRFAYTGACPPKCDLQACWRGSLEEWLMERYTAFNAALGWRRYFRVWHPPWRQCRVELNLDDVNLLRRAAPWLADGRMVQANFCAGWDRVWMGRPRRVA